MKKLKAKQAVSAAAVLFLGMMTVRLTHAATELYMVPSVNNFSTSATSPGFRWNTTFWLNYASAPGVFAYQVKCDFNPSWLEVTRAWLPNSDPEWIFYGRLPVMPFPVIDNTLGFVLIGDSLLMGPATVGPGPLKLAIAEFRTKTAPGESETLYSDLDINNVDTYLLNEALSEITPMIMSSGSATYMWSLRVWDITGPTQWVPDDKCDIRDVGLVATLFGSVEGDGRYNERADITGSTDLVADGEIDIRDIALVALHFGESY